MIFELPNDGGLVTVNTKLVRQTQASSHSVESPLTTLIFDEDDRFDVVGHVGDIAGRLGLASDDVSSSATSDRVSAPPFN